VLSVLACRHVDQVIIGAPYKVTNELLEQFKASIVIVIVIDVFLFVLKPWALKQKLEDLLFKGG